MPGFSAEELSALEPGIMLAAEQHEQNSSRSNGNYSRLFHYGNLSVKYNDHVSIVQESWALHYLHELATKGGDTAPHEPRVVHYFYRLNRWGYIIMERIGLRDISGDELCREAAKAVRWLHAQHMDFGSLGSANTRHTVFQGGKAPKPFTSVAAVQTYLNAAVDRVQHQQQSWMTPLAKINLVGDDVVLTQSDMDPSNFGVALDGRPVVFDAATMQALPKTLADFTLLCTIAFAKVVSTYVFQPRERAALLASPSFSSLAKVRSS